MACDHDEAINAHSDRMDVMIDKVHHLRREVESLRAELCHPHQPEVVDLTGDDEEEGLVVGENEVPLMICVERNETVVPETPGVTLVEIEEEGRSPPQIVGEVEWRFAALERMQRSEEYSLTWDKEADEIARSGVTAPEYGTPPPDYS